MNQTSEVTERWALDAFQECGALLEGHFVLASKRHTGHYVDKDAVTPWDSVLDPMCYTMARYYVRRNPQVVVGLATAGIAIARGVGRCLNEMKGDKLEIPVIYADKPSSSDDPGGLVFRRAHKMLVSGKRVLIVEDIATTGGSVKKAMDLVRSCDGELLGIGFLWNRGGVDFGVPSFSLITKQFPSYASDECPLCAKGVEYNTDVGHAAA